MNPWDKHERWDEELRAFLGDDADELTNDDIMFVSNLAAQLSHNEISLPKALEEIHKWLRQQMGFIGMHDEESFRLELAVNYPQLIDVTRAVKENLRIAEEPGIADGLVQVFADPNFEEWISEGSAVAIQSKAWLRLEGLTHAEHQAMGWAISMAVKDRNDGN